MSMLKHTLKKSFLHKTKFPCTKTYITMVLRGKQFEFHLHHLFYTTKKKNNL